MPASASRSVYFIDRYWADSTGRRNAPTLEKQMTTGRRKSERSTRRRLSSPGRPPVWQRETLCWFWQGIAAGLSSEEAGVEAGVSAPVGSRWFRSSGGMPPTHLAPSAPQPTNRNLSFAEREEIALECARKTGVRAIARKTGVRAIAQTGAFAQHDLPRDQT